MKKIFILVLIISFVTSCGSNFDYLSGNNTAGLIDGYPTSAKFDYPTRMDVDEQGNLYVLDQKGTAIRKITLDGNVSTILKDYPKLYKDNERYSGSIKIKDNYLYFASDFKIIRLNLIGDNKFENFLGTNEQIDKDGSFEDARFYFIHDINFDNLNNLVINTDFDRKSKKIKVVNFMSKKVESLKLKSNIISLDDKDNSKIYSSFSQIDINPINNHIYFSIKDTFSEEIYKINDKNEISKNEISQLNSLVIGSFIHDKDGNLYMTAIDKKSIIKISPDNNTENLSNLNGVLNIKIDSGFPEYGYPSSYLTIDNKRNILYLSSPNDNKIFKIQINKKR